MGLRKHILYLLAILFVFLIISTISGKEKSIPLDKDPALEGWWKFEETIGKTTADASPHKRKGTLLGEFSFEDHSAEGKVGKALKFTGKDTYVKIKDYKGVTGTGPRSVTAWIRTTNSKGDIVLWGANDSGKQFRFGHIRGRIGLTPFGGYYYMKEYTRDDKWHHIAVVVGESELPNLHDDVTLYLDGEVAVIDDIGLLDLLPIETASELDVRIGSGFEGLMDDLRIYKRPLTEAEVKTIYLLKSDKPTPKD
ncbi:MAG: LamG domain-containing protein [Sedimentisphaerales bacterium]|nr:LamG domain-containing protein [Sedimentisphaerales bacterium]